jgi:hypothetical protein
MIVRINILLFNLLSEITSRKRNGSDLPEELAAERSRPFLGLA